MAGQGVQAVLTGRCGPNTYWVLHTAGVRVCTGVVESTVREAVRQFQAGLLREAAAADVQPHW
jgi:predicted Fe-Mo cluster-binding NifX family protein